MPLKRRPSAPSAKRITAPDDEAGNTAAGLDVEEEPVLVAALDVADDDAGADATRAISTFTRL